MFKRTKKLALKKESLRNLSEAELGSVNGGTQLYVAYNDWDRYIYKMPVIGTTSRTDSGYYFW